MACGKSVCCGDTNCLKNKKEIDEEEDDIWGEELEVNSTADIKRIHTKQGYLDGLSHAKESSLQSGFDEAYPSGADIGIQVGFILSTILSMVPDQFEACKKELAISNVLNKEFFSDDLDMSHNDVLSKWSTIVLGVLNGSES